MLVTRSSTTSVREFKLVAVFAFFCQHTSFVSSIEPMKANEALQDPNRLIVVQQELDNFSHIKVWMLMESCDPKQHIIIGTCGSS
jgi:hypothetical protein